MSVMVWPPDFGPVICVVGARPNFMKMAPILRAFASHRPAMPALLVHTGQHYDRDMSENTERPITVSHGTNTLVGRDTAAILAGGGKRGRVPELWDGRAAERIAADLGKWLTSRHARQAG